MSDDEFAEDIQRALESVTKTRPAMREYFGRSDNDLTRAEETAHRLASSHGGSKQFHVIEAGTLDLATAEAVEEKGRIYVCDNAGREELLADESFTWKNEIVSYGYEEDE